MINHSINQFLQVPLVPLVPALSIMINVYLMVNMRMVTWIQYSIYMAIGKALTIVAVHI